MSQRYLNEDTIDLASEREEIKEKVKKQQQERAFSLFSEAFRFEFCMLTKAIRFV